jgi:DivIVA domain-containing protein
MIDLTPLDVRKKRGDFAKTLRGYNASEVDHFLELVAERMEALVKEKLELEEHSDTLRKKVDAQEGRENAIQEALVTAQKLREDVKSQAQQEAEFLLREARGRIEGMVNAAGRTLVERRAMLEELERQRERFLKSFRMLLERELDNVELEFGREPIEDITLDVDVGPVGPLAEGNDSVGAPVEAVAEEIAEEVVEEVTEVAPRAGTQPGPGAQRVEDPPPQDSEEEPPETLSTERPDERPESDEVTAGAVRAVDDTAVDVPKPDAGEEVVAGKDTRTSQDTEAGQDTGSEQDTAQASDEDSLWLSSILSKPDITEAE